MLAPRVACCRRGRRPRGRVGGRGSGRSPPRRSPRPPRRRRARLEVQRSAAPVQGGHRSQPGSPRGRWYRRRGVWKWSTAWPADRRAPSIVADLLTEAAPGLATQVALVEPAGRRLTWRELGARRSRASAPGLGRLVGGRTPRLLALRPGRVRGGLPRGAPGGGGAGEPAVHARGLQRMLANCGARLGRASSQAVREAVPARRSGRRVVVVGELAASATESSTQGRGRRPTARASAARPRAALLYTSGATVPCSPTSSRSRASRKPAIRRRGAGRAAAVPRLRARGVGAVLRQHATLVLADRLANRLDAETMLDLVADQLRGAGGAAGPRSLALGRPVAERGSPGAGGALRRRAPGSRGRGGTAPPHRPPGPPGLRADRGVPGGDQHPVQPRPAAPLGRRRPAQALRYATRPAGRPRGGPGRGRGLGPNLFSGC